jgi:hypothetical protein
MAYPSCGQLARVAFRTASYLICVIEKQPEKLQEFVLELPQLLRKTCPYLTGNQPLQTIDDKIVTISGK